MVSKLRGEGVLKNLYFTLTVKPDIDQFSKQNKNLEMCSSIFVHSIKTYYSNVMRQADNKHVVSKKVYLFYSEVL